MKPAPKFIGIVALFLQTMLFAVQAPDFIPSPPAPEKPLTDYTVLDVLGCNAFDDLPANHKFHDGYNAGLKAHWPGAKVATNIDTLCQIMLDAPAADPVQKGMVESLESILRVVVREAMDVTDAAKTDALLRVVAAQTTPAKRARAVKFASSYFGELLDPRLLNLQKERLDDESVAFRIVAEENPEIQITVRAAARGEILHSLQNDLGIQLDIAAFEIEDEAAACAALKAWLNENAALVEGKCADAKAKPDRKLPEVLPHRAWDNR